MTKFDKNETLQNTKEKKIPGQSSKWGWIENYYFALVSANNRSDTHTSASCSQGRQVAVKISEGLIHLITWSSTVTLLEHESLFHLHERFPRKCFNAAIRCHLATYLAIYLLKVLLLNSFINNGTQKLLYNTFIRKHDYTF